MESLLILTAEEAREITDRSKAIIHPIMARIKNAALDQESEIKVINIDNTTIKKLISLGYSIHPKSEEETLTTISW